MTIRRQIGSYEAKTKLPSLLEQVSKGESFTITRRGRPIAVLSPVNSNPLESLDEAVESIRTLRKKYQLKGLPIKKLISEGRK